MQTPVKYEYALNADGAVLLSVYGNSPELTLPEALDGHPLTALAPYCFAPQQRERLLPPPEKRLRCAPDGPAEAADHRIAGSFVQSVHLPAGLRVIGDCAFYNCRSLTTLYTGTAIEAIGSDVFMNTMQLRTAVLEALPSACGSLHRLLDHISTDLRVEFRQNGKTVAAAWFPEFWEDVEETPAHILLHTYAGQGYHYRQCFAGSSLLWKEYDACFLMARAEDPAAVITRLALDRLLWPVQLEEEARSEYAAWISDHAALCIKQLEDAADTATLDLVLAKKLLPDAALRTAAAQAAEKGNAAFALRLTAAMAEAQPKAAKKNRYSFDF